jgi:hypothetical protein
MRELRDWHGDHHRHARDSAADAHTEHAADSPRFRVLRDSEVRKAEFFKLQKAVQEYEPKHAAAQLKPQEAKPEHAPPETRDKPASKISERTKPPERQEQKQRKPERSRLPANDTTQVVAGIGIALSSVADALNVLPGKWDAVAASFLGAAVASVAWGNRRWKDKHGNRPED